MNISQNKFMEEVILLRLSENAHLRNGFTKMVVLSQLCPKVVYFWRRAL